MRALGTKDGLEPPNSCRRRQSGRVVQTTGAAAIRAPQVIRELLCVEQAHHSRGSAVEPHIDRPRRAQTYGNDGTDANPSSLSPQHAEPHEGQDGHCQCPALPKASPARGRDLVADRGAGRGAKTLPAGYGAKNPSPGWQTTARAFRRLGCSASRARCRGCRARPEKDPARQVGRAPHGAYGRQR